jgi:hypothetical protein
MALLALNQVEQGRSPTPESDTKKFNSRLVAPTVFRKEALGGERRWASLLLKLELRRI